MGARGLTLERVAAYAAIARRLHARLAARGHEPLAELVIGYAVKGFGMSRGTMRSALEILKGGDVVYEEGDWRPAPLGVLRSSFDFPAPTGRQAVVRYPSGEVITVPRHTGTRRVASVVTARMMAPHPVLAPAVAYMQPPLALTLRTPLRGVLSRAVGALPDGPGRGNAGRRSSRSSPRLAARTAPRDGASCAGQTSTGSRP